MPDTAWLARLARHGAHLERRHRLGFANAKAKLKALAVTGARNGESVTPPKPVAVAPEISEAEIRRE
jgi:hypothetical protein